MNILFYSYFDVAPQKGGTERITASVSTGLRKMGCRCFLVYDCDVDKTLTRIPFDGRMKVGRLTKTNNAERFKQFVIFNKINVIVIQGLFDKAAQIKKVMTGYSMHIVFVHHFNPGAEETFFSFMSVYKSLQNNKNGKFRNFVRLILFPILKMKNIIKLHKNYRTTYMVADKTVLLSKGFINEFMYYARINDKSKFYVIHNALSFSMYFDMSKYEQKHKEVIVVSRLEERQKRISLALKIWSAIEQMPQFSDWNLLIIGNGSDEEKYKKFVREKGLSHVFFEGRQNPEPYYQKASIFMMTSSFEGWGLTLTEAQQYGVVPLAFNSYASVSDIITDKYNGYLVSNNDINSYVKYLTLLMSDYDLRHRMALNCIESSKRFERQHICNQWIQLFKQLM